MTGNWPTGAGARAVETIAGRDARNRSSVITRHGECLRNCHVACYDSVMPEPTRPSEVFPGRLRAAREKRGLNQGDLASRAGLQASAISHFETGTRKPSFDNLRRLADALDVTTDYLLGRVTESRLLAGADKLYRDLDRLTANDRDIAKDFLEMLADKASDRGGKEGR